MSARHFNPADYLDNDKPAKPNPDFPLFPHANGTWAKKIKGRLHYFGPWGDADAALAKYLAEKDDLHAGRTPRPDPGNATVKDAANRFLNHKATLLEAGALSKLTWRKYKEAVDVMVGRFGKTRLVADLRQDDFTGLKGHRSGRWGPHRMADFIQIVRSVFKHAFDTELIDKPVRFGPGFDPPSQKVLRLHRARQGENLFSREEVLRLLEASPAAERAMAFLGLNCAYGNRDVATLPLTALDLDGGWASYHREKTGMHRRCPLWPETVQALRDALAARPEPREGHAGLVFLTRWGTPWMSIRQTNYTDKVAAHFGQLLRKLGINGRRRLGFYTLRHVFRTVADESKDQPAVDFIMGHSDGHVSAHYRERISDDRLRAVADYVHAWLFPPAKPTGAAKSDEEE
jgi:integrase